MGLKRGVPRRSIRPKSTPTLKSVASSFAARLCFRYCAHTEDVAGNAEDVAGARTNFRRKPCYHISCFQIRQPWSNYLPAPTFALAYSDSPLRPPSTRAEDAAAQAVSCPEGMPMAKDYGYNTSCGRININLLPPAINDAEPLPCTSPGGTPGTSLAWKHPSQGRQTLDPKPLVAGVPTELHLGLPYSKE
jgi:hypothetical protein